MTVRSQALIGCIQPYDEMVLEEDEETPFWNGSEATGPSVMEWTDEYDSQAGRSQLLLVRVTTASYLKIFADFMYTYSLMMNSHRRIYAFYNLEQLTFQL